jgi:cytochrome bd-type quinol oxidase subunit 2
MAVLGGRIENPLFPSSSLFHGGGPDRGPLVLHSVLTGLISLMLTGGVVVFIFYFLYGALTWIMSEGEEAKVKDARQRVTHSLIGLFVLFLIFVILKLVGTVFGLEWLRQLKLLIPTLG